MVHGPAQTCMQRGPARRSHCEYELNRKFGKLEVAASLTLRTMLPYSARRVSMGQLCIERSTSCRTRTRFQSSLCCVVTLLEDGLAAKAEGMKRGGSKAQHSTRKPACTRYGE